MEIIQVVLCLSYIASSINGAIICIKTKTSLYTKLVVCAIVCASLSALNTTLLYNIFGIYLAGFRLADIGIFASFMFLLSANYGTMDDILDEGQREYRRYRLLAILAPIGITIIIVLYCIFGVDYLSNKISFIVITFPGQASSYYSLKHTILPDNGLNFAKPMRPFNVLSIVYVYLCALEVLFNNLDFLWAGSIVSLLLSFVGILIIPACVAGSKKRNEF